MKTILLIAAWLTLSLPLWSQGSNTMGKPVSTKLVDFRIPTSAKVTVKAVDVSASGDIVTVKVYINYLNTGNESFTWEFASTALVDAHGRQYDGMSWFNPNSMRKFRGFIRELQPGMSTNNFVYFKLPKAAFKGNISFCFRTSTNKPQCLITIFDKKRSSYEFEKPATFSTAVWE
jgi:hypothetical protein